MRLEVSNYIGFSLTLNLWCFSYLLGAVVLLEMVHELTNLESLGRLNGIDFGMIYLLKVVKIKGEDVESGGSALGNRSGCFETVYPNSRNYEERADVPGEKTIKHLS